MIKEHTTSKRGSLMPDPKPRPLTPKQQRFVEEYCANGFNGTQAAITAGYKANSAQQTASENLSKPLILKAVQAELQRLSEATGVTAEDVIRGLHEEATDRSDKSKHSARVSAWSWLGKYFKMFTEKHEHEHTGSVEVKVTEVTLEYPEEEEPEE